VHLNVLHLDRTLLRILSYDAGLTIAIDINTVSKTQSNNKGISVHVIKLLRHTSSSLYVLFIHLGKLYHQQPRQSVVETRTKQEHLQTLLRNGVSTTTIYQTTSKPHRTFHCSIPRIQTNESHVWEGLWKVWELPIGNVCQMSSQTPTIWYYILCDILIRHTDMLQARHCSDV